MQHFALWLPLVLAAPSAAQGFQRAPVSPPPSGVGASCAPRPIVLPSYRQEVDLAPWAACGGGGAQPFCVTYTPDGSRVYASLFGGFIGNGGCTVVRLDPITFQVLGSVTTGESPEDIAFVTHPDGTLRYGFVSDSSASTVTVFDATDQVVTTIPIPFDAQATYPTAFPFGFAVHPAGSRVYVGTGDGQGFVHAIDVDSLSLDAAATIHLGADHGAARMAFAGDRLVIAATRYLGSSGSTAKVMVVDPALPSLVEELVLASSSGSFLFPAPQEVAIDCSGRAWIAGFDLGARVFAIDPEGPTLLQTIPTHTSQADGKFQALGLSQDGMLWVGDLWTSELALIDVRRGHWIRTIDSTLFPSFHRAPHEIAFEPGGDTAVVAWAASDDLAVFDL